MRSPRMTADICLWQPGWMKDSGSMNSGSLLAADVQTYANYLFKTVQGFAGKGYTPWAISIQVSVGAK